MASQTDEATTALLSTLHSASSSWSKFNLDNRRSTLTAASNATREAKEQSAAARKSLASSTKNLKKSLAAATTAASTSASSSGGDGGSNSDATRTAVAELAKIIKSTVKSYQEEIEPLRESSLELARESFGAGKSGFLVVLEAQKRLLAARRDAISWVEASSVMVVELEAACGRPMNELLERPEVGASSE